MIDTTAVLSFLLCPQLFTPINFGSSGISIIPPTHHPLLCQANHGKPLATSGLAASGLEAFGSVVFGSMLLVWQLWDLWLFILAVSVDCFGFSGGWFHGFDKTGCAVWGFVVVGSAAAGFEALDSAASGLAVVSFKQQQVYHPDAAEPTSHRTKCCQSWCGESCRFNWCHFGQMQQSTNSNI